MKPMLWPVIFCAWVSIHCPLHLGAQLATGDRPTPITQPPHNPDRAPIPADFESTIAPLLARHCLECHSSGTKQGGLDLSQATAAMAGGESGPAIQPGDAAASLLWQRVEAGEMPEDRPPLSQTEREQLQQWLNAGAAWNTGAGDGRIDPMAYSSERRAGYDFWSLKPPALPPIPDIEDPWIRNDIDRFVLETLHEHQLLPAAAADRQVLIRRVYFDLIGLPPTPAAVHDFVIDSRPDAYARLVDQLLESPHYGERWARHWLDVVRFGETQGFERNRIRPNAWRYRDWVVQALNQDLPYDEFVRQQVAGDVLYPGDYDATIATGFHVCGTWDQVGHVEGSATMQHAARWDHLEDLVGTLSQSFLGLTVNCSRCHDHKFDPISQTEFYQMAALLGGIHQQEKERSDLQLQSDATKPRPPGAAFDFSGTAHISVARQPPVFHVLSRGDSRNPLNEVAPRGLRALGQAGLADDFGLPIDAPENQRRLKLAQWLSDRRNPLTARVIVNRLWHHHFGRGIVDTPSDFGFNGGRPTHPELLDWLAVTLMDEAWSLKAIHRLILNSATYQQQANVSNPAANAIDQDNRWLWRANVRRLEGEAVRDAMLLVAGELNLEMGGPSFQDMHVNDGNNAEFTAPTNEFSDAVNRRTLYRLWARSGNNPLLQSLDCPDPSVAAPLRSRTITAVQALSLMNNSTIETCAQRLADRLQSLVDAQTPERTPGLPAQDNSVELAKIEQAYQCLFARSPTPSEIELAKTFLKQYPWDQYCLVLLNTNEFLIIN